MRSRVWIIVALKCAITHTRDGYRERWCLVTLVEVIQCQHLRHLYRYRQQGLRQTTSLCLLEATFAATLSGTGPTLLDASNGELERPLPSNESYFSVWEF